MRHSVRLALLVAACAITACSKEQPQEGAVVAVSTADDAKAVEGVLRAWYDASEKHDSVAYAAPLLPEFFIFEDTTRYDKATLVQLVASSFAEGTDHADMRDFNTVVIGDAAWTSFHNDEVFTTKSGEVTPMRRYLETATFRRVGGRWMMERYHATRINRPAPAP